MGKDLVNHGIEPGKTLGKLLQSCKAWWLQELGEPNFQECLSFVQNQVSKVSDGAESEV